MTKESSGALEVAQKAAEAAALIKTTAESTATALNIQYMQKDIVEIKDTLKTIVLAQDGKVDTLEKKIEKLTNLVYVGVGMATTISFILPLVLKFFYR